MCTWIRRALDDLRLHGGGTRLDGQISVSVYTNQAIRSISITIIETNISL